MIEVTELMLVKALFYLYLAMLFLSIIAVHTCPKYTEKMNKFPYPALWLSFFIGYPIAVAKLFHLFERAASDEVLFTIGGLW